MAPLCLLPGLGYNSSLTPAGNAKIEGLPEDLGLNDAQYNTCLAIFFVPYVLLEVPSNYILSRVNKPSIYLGILVTGWGVVSTLTGITKNFAGLLVVRFFLGVFEAGFFPGAVFTVSRWYLPGETQTRIAVFYTASALSGAFSGLLAAGLTKMDGLSGVAGWRWIFLIEGIITVMAGVMAFFCMPDSPSLSTKWLDADEIRYLELRQRADPSRRAAARFTADGERQKDRGVLWSVLTDWQIYLQALTFWGNSVPNNALKFTMPSIVKSMGFTSTNAQLMTVPPYVAGAIISWVSALLADRLRWRMPFVVGPLSLVIIAFAVLYSFQGKLQENIGPAYFSIVLACLGLYPLNPTTCSWTLNNLAGPTKRAMGIAFMISMGNTGRHRPLRMPGCVLCISIEKVSQFTDQTTGGLVGSYIFIGSEAPKYPTGFGCAFAFAAAGVVTALILEFLYKHINKKRDALTDAEIYSRYTREELDAMGDRSPLFRYTL
jgi:MFS family permease